MSFGGGSTQYFIDYKIRVSKEGTGATTAFTDISNGAKQATTSIGMTTQSFDKMKAAHERVIQGTQGVTKAMKGMAFGILGITTAGAEAIGMWGMYQQTAEAVTAAQDEQSRALKESGKNSKDYKDATNELVKAQRWQRMTQRNLMLSFFDLVPFIILTINGLVKYKNALKELQEARRAEQALRALAGTSGTVAKQLGAASLAANAAGLNISRYGKGLVLAQGQSFKFTTEAVKSSKAMVGIDTAAIASAASMSKMEASTTRLGKAMRVLGIAMKIAIPLVILEIASQAFQNNWGGFADKVNALGKAFGDAMPAAKGFLDIIGKVGRSIVAIFTGNWDQIGQIWNGANKVQEENTQISEKQAKAQEELRKSLIETGNAASELVTDIVDMDKKERKSFLFGAGIKGGAKNRFMDVAKDLDKLKDVFSGFTQDLKLVRLDEQLGNWFDLPKSFYKKTLFTFEDRFKKLGKEFGDKGLTNLGNEMRKAAKSGKGFEAYKQAVINAVKFDPTLMSKLEVLDPQAYAEFKKILDEAGTKLSTAVQDSSLGSGFGHGGIKGTILDPNSGENQQGKTGVGLLDNLTNSITSGIETLKTEITNADWVSVGASLRTGILKIFSPSNLQIAGATIRIMVVDPLVKTLQGAFGGLVKALGEDPVGTLLNIANTVTLDITSLVAGIFGYKSEDEMFTDWENQLVTAFNGSAALVGLKRFINNPVQWIIDNAGGLESKETAAGDFNAHESTAFPNRGTSDVGAKIKQVLDGLVVPVAAGYNKWVSELSSDPTVNNIAAWKSNPVEALWHVIDTSFKSIGFVFETAKQQDIKQGNSGKSVWDQTLGAKLEEIKTGYDKWVSELPNNVIVQNLAAWINDPIGSIKHFIDTTMSGFKPTFVSSNTQTKTTGLKPGESVLSTWWTENAQPVMTTVTGWGTTLTSWWNGLGVVGQWAAKAWAGVISIGDAIKNLIQQDAFAQGTGDSTNTDKEGAKITIAGIDTKTITSDIGKITDAFQTFFKALGGELSNLADAWDGIMKDIIKSTDKAVANVEDDWAGFFDNLGKELINTDDAWTGILKDIVKTNKKQLSSIEDDWGGFFSAMGKEMINMEEAWSGIMDDMVSDAKDAANKIENTLASIPDETVTIHVQKVFEFAKGGELGSFARGGVISAAGGKRLTTNGPTYLLGDNPGGQESLWAIPHNNPRPTVNNINRTYGTSGGGSEGTVFNGTFNFKISGNDIIDERKLSKKVRMTIGQNMDRFG